MSDLDDKLREIAQKIYLRGKYNENGMISNVWETDEGGYVADIKQLFKEHGWSEDGDS